MSIFDRFSSPNIAKLVEKHDIQRLIKLLFIKEWRDEAKSALMRLKDPLSVPPLIDIVFMQGEDYQVSRARELAIYILGELKDKRAASALTLALNDPKFEIRKAALIYIGDIGDSSAIQPLIDLLISCLEDPEPDLLVQDLGERSARALGKLKAEQSYELLIRALNSGFSSGAADGLKFLGDPRTVQPLIRQLGNPRASGFKTSGDEFHDPRWRIADALGELGDSQAVETLIPFLTDSNPNMVTSTASALGKLGDPKAIEPLLAARNNLDERIRHAVENALERLDPDGSKRAALGAGEIPVSDRIREYQHALSSDNQRQELEAIKGLSSIGTPEAVDALLSGLDGDAYGAIATDTFNTLVRELTLLDKEKLIHMLCHIYSRLSPRHVKKTQILSALGNLGGPEAEGLLQGALAEADPNLVRLANEGLKKLEK